MMEMKMMMMTVVVKKKKKESVIKFEVCVKEIERRDKKESTMQELQ